MGFVCGVGGESWGGGWLWFGGPGLVSYRL